MEKDVHSISQKSKEYCLKKNTIYYVNVYAAAILIRYTGLIFKNNLTIIFLLVLKMTTITRLVQKTL